jgi:hypothetical protein
MNQLFNCKNVKWNGNDYEELIINVEQTNINFNDDLDNDSDSDSDSDSDCEYYDK